MGGVVDVVTDVASVGTDVVSNGIEVVGKDVLDDALGLDSVGAEVGRWGEDLGQVSDVLRGEYHERARELQERQEDINNRINEYNSTADALQDKIESLLAFHEIFQLAASNRFEEFSNVKGTELEKLVEALKVDIAQLQSDFDFVIGLTEGPFIQRFVGSVLMIIGGIVNDTSELLTGNISSDLMKRLVVDVLLVIAVILAIPSGGLTLTLTAGMVTFVLVVIGAFMTLDGMYANGAATGAIMSALDFLFNDVLNLDDRVGKDFDKFDEDHEDYAEMVMYTKLIIALASIGTGMVAQQGAATATASTAGTAMESSVQEFVMTDAGFVGAETGAGQAALGGAGTTSYLGGTIEINKGNMMSSTVGGVKFSTYSQIYKAYSTAKGVNDVVNMNEQYEALVTKIQEDKEKLEAAVNKKISKNFVKSYKDVAYFLQDQQEFVDRYVWGMTAQNMYVDPYGTTPVANIRFTPDKETRIMSYGYEDVFDESKAAGSRGYFNSILYG